MDFQVGIYTAWITFFSKLLIHPRLISSAEAVTQTENNTKGNPKLDSARTCDSLTPLSLSTLFCSTAHSFPLSLLVSRIISCLSTENSPLYTSIYSLIPFPSLLPSPPPTHRFAVASRHRLVTSGASGARGEEDEGFLVDPDGLVRSEYALHGDV